jgi:hypothetical protein
MLTFGEDRQYGGNVGYADELSRAYRYDSLVPNSRRVAAGDLVVLRDRKEMLGVAAIAEIVSHAASKVLRRCPTCGTTKFGERSSREPRFRCRRGHGFGEPVEDRKDCEEFEARFGTSFRSAVGALSLADLRAACRRYTDQLSIQALDPPRIASAIEAVGLWMRNDGEGSERSPTPLAFGLAYRPANERIMVGDRDPFAVDPAIVERGNRGHATTQNALAAFLQANGIEPRSPASNEPEFDLGWLHGETTFVSEVKSTTAENEEKQLRLGLGQVLRYRHILTGTHGSVVPVLAVERAPRDSTWLQLCETLGVVLVWPDRFDGILPAIR